MLCAWGNKILGSLGVCPKSSSIGHASSLFFFLELFGHVAVSCATSRLNIPESRQEPVQLCFAAARRAGHRLRMFHSENEDLDKWMLSAKTSVRITEDLLTPGYCRRQWLLSRASALVLAGQISQPLPASCRNTVEHWLDSQPLSL